MRLQRLRPLALAHGLLPALRSGRLSVLLAALVPVLAPLVLLALTQLAASSLPANRPDPELPLSLPLSLPVRTAPSSHTAASTVIRPLLLPAAGSYVLDHIMHTPVAQVQDSDGSVHPLADFTTAKVTLFALIYTACSGERGCPLALATMHELKAAIEQDRQLRGQVRFVSMSFDPSHDTFNVMRSYGGMDARADAHPRWYFLTTQSPGQLAAVLAGFGQDVNDVAGMQADADDGAPAQVSLSHLLKMYLIDRNGDVREIYSPAFLQAQTMLVDIRTLAALPSSYR
ncbi:SCO family protein [Massilia sp. PWRC2]|uniref:SCO family protein n=1 Tax=Massilia sp. PWRC2 TaxID=2804626 RepID=UPI003CF67929